MKGPEVFGPMRRELRMWEPPKDQQIQARRADVIMGHVASQMATLITVNMLLAKSLPCARQALSLVREGPCPHAGTAEWKRVAVATCRCGRSTIVQSYYFE